MDSCDWSPSVSTIWESLSNTTEIESCEWSVEEDEHDILQSHNIAGIMPCEWSESSNETTVMSSSIEVHGLTEFDVLLAHSTFSTKSSSQQRQWLLDYFVSHCPNGKDATRDPKHMQYLISGRNVCQCLISVSRFYDIRKAFLEGKCLTEPENHSRSLTSKSLQCIIAWMGNYFDRIGDKRPDANGIYLPTCLTVRMIYTIMVEEIFCGDSSSGVCFSQFNKLYRTHFQNVTIPKIKVRWWMYV